jgi:tRNA(Ile)-lysidine synthase
VRGLDDAGAGDPLEATVRAALDRRLRRDIEAPLAVALSGGGDSLALALILAGWARDAGRSLLILTVDHRLRAESEAWAQACAETAGRLSARFQALTWDGPKPPNGIAAAARQARHRLLAQAARAAGARVILMGHTASDVAEAEAMRAAGSTTPSPKAWSPSPVWPQGRGLFILRPMLGLTREAVRAWLAARRETWIDDPANADPESARVQARAQTAGQAPSAASDPATLSLGESCRFDPAGGVYLSRQALRDATPEDGAALIGIATVCAGGGDRLPSSERLRRLREILTSEAGAATSLAGARIETAKDEVSFLREPGEAKRGGLATLYLTPGKPLVWDGRFEFTASRPGLHVDRLEGLSRRLPKPEQLALRPFAPKARLGLPALVDGEAISCPALQPVEGVETRLLVAERLFAACGLVEREPA